MDPAALDTVGRALNLPVLHTGPVQEGTRVQVGRIVVPDAGVWAFQAQQGEIGPVIEIPDAFFLFRLDSVQEGGPPLLASIRPSVETRGTGSEEVGRGPGHGQGCLSSGSAKGAPWPRWPMPSSFRTRISDPSPG